MQRRGRPPDKDDGDCFGSAFLRSSPRSLYRHGLPLLVHGEEEGVLDVRGPETFTHHFEDVERWIFVLVCSLCPPPDLILVLHTSRLH